MKNIVYSEKEIDIFNGIIALMQRGINPYSIKVSDIAEAANVGKGTIYDYFSSKEEAISQAILYNINQQLDEVYIGIRKKNGFKEKFYEIFHIIERCTESNVSIVKTLLSLGGIQEFYEYLSDYKGGSFQYVSHINRIFLHLLEAGSQEGVIKEGEYLKEKPYYLNMVMGSAIMGFSQYFHQKSLYPDMGVEEAMDASYKLLTKALG